MMSRTEGEATLSNSARTERHEAVNELKRSLIIQAARRVFEAEGLEGASLRVIAKEAGYTTGAIYFHFPSKEAIYAEVLRELLERLVKSVEQATAGARTPRDRLVAGALAWFDFFADDPRDLDFGFYLLKGGMRPRGLSKALDAELNGRLAASLAPISQAATELGHSKTEARALQADVFAHAAGLLLLKHTHRIRMFGADPRKLMQGYLSAVLGRLGQSR
jgi:AcrR family transcriptional regulator